MKHHVQSEPWRKASAEQKVLDIHDFFAAVGIAVGLAGIVLIFLPGLAIEVGTVGLWAWIDGNTVAWSVFAASVLIAGATTFLKYQRPGRRLKESGVPSSHLIGASLVAFVGFFVVPVVGALIGFVLAIYVLALARVGRAEAWPSTKAALKAIVHSTGIELAGGSLIAVIWVITALTL